MQRCSRRVSLCGHRRVAKATVLGGEGAKCEGNARVTPLDLAAAAPTTVRCHPEDECTAAAFFHTVLNFSFGLVQGHVHKRIIFLSWVQMRMGGLPKTT